MAGHEHPLIAGAFLTLVVGAVGGAAVYKLLHPTHSKHAEAEPDHGTPPEIEPATVSEQIMAAIRIGEEGDMEAAAEILAVIVRGNPENADALFNLGIALGALERHADADKVFARILELNPKDWEATAERAGLQIAQGKIDDAFAMMDQIPAGEGRLSLRLDEDPRWKGVRNDPRLTALRSKHGLGAPKANAATGTVAQP
jgi:tetratricopeptide (TPR) repeat protein